MTREPLENNASTGVSKTREKREANATARHKTTGKTPKHPTTNQHPGVSHTSLSRLQSIPQANPSEKTSQLKAEIGETEESR